MAKACTRTKRFDRSPATHSNKCLPDSATSDFFDSLMVMRRITICGILVLVLLVVATASAARARRKTPTRCMQVHARLITADGQAQVYEATEPEAFPEYLGVVGMCLRHNRPYFLGPLPYGSSSGGSAGVEHETLVGPVVAYGEASSSGPRSRRSEWHVVVRDLRTGRVLHRVPTGTPLEPEPEYIGVGNVVSIVVNPGRAVSAAPPG